MTRYRLIKLNIFILSFVTLSFCFAAADEYILKFKNCDFPNGLPFTFNDFPKANLALTKAYENYAEKCNPEEYKEALAAAKAAGNESESTANTAKAAEDLGKEASGISAAFDGLCQGLEETYEAAYKEAEGILKKEKLECLREADSTGRTRIDTKAPPVPPSCEAAVNENKLLCNKSLQNKISKMESLRNWVGNHKMLMGGLIAAAGAGAYSLMKSGKEAKDQMSTAPSKPKKENEIEVQKKIPEAEIAAANQASANHPDSASYCNSSLKPLECFVTASCGLQCVAEKFGVDNYTDMNSNSTRIDPNGRAVANTASNGENASTPNSNNGNGNNSGSGKLSLNDRDEAKPSLDGQRQLSSFSSGDEDGGYGGGSMNYGDASSGETGGDSLKKPLTAAQQLEAAKARGPINGPLSPSVFEAVRNNLRSQYSRGLLLTESPK